MKIYLIPSEDWKFGYLRECLRVSKNKLEKTDVDVTEIQSTEGRRITELSSRDASYKLGKPVVKWDAYWAVEELGGFPGAYWRQLSKWFSQKEWKKIFVDLKDRNATWEEVLSYTEPGKKPVTFSCRLEGRLSNVPKGTSDSILEKYFIPKGQKQTMAELNKKNRGWNANSVTKSFVHFLLQNKPHQKSYELTQKQIVVVLAIIRKGDKILLTKRNSKNFYPAEVTVHFPNKKEHFFVERPRWEFPGGLVDFGETIEEATRREVAEETGFEVTVDQISPWLLTQESISKRSHVHCVLIPVWCTLTKERDFIPNQETEDVKWVSISSREVKQNPISSFLFKNRKRTIRSLQPLD